MFYVSNLTEEKFSVYLSEFPAVVWIPEVRWKWNPIIFADDVTVYVTKNNDAPRPHSGVNIPSTGTWQYADAGHRVVV